MTMFRTVAGALTLYAGNPKVAHFPILLADRTPQNLSGRSFAFAVRRAVVSTPLLVIPMLLSGDALYTTVPITAAAASLIYADGVEYRLVYEVIETTGGASTTRWIGDINVQPSASLPGDADAAPAWVDLPYAELVADGFIVAFSERGGQGPTASRQLKDQGLIPADDVLLMDARYMEAAKPFADAAELAAEDAAAKAEAADAARVQSEAARDGALLGSATIRQFLTREQGLADTELDEIFMVIGDGYAIAFYQNPNIDTPLAAVTSEAAFAALASLIKEGSAGFSADDPDGFSLFAVDGAGNATIAGDARINRLDILRDLTGHLTILDADGFTGFDTDPAFVRLFSRIEGRLFDKLAERILTEGGGRGLSVSDPDGFDAFSVSEDGVIAGRALRLAKVDITNAYPQGLLVLDPDGFTGFDSAAIPAPIDADGDVDAGFADRDAANLALSAAVARQFNTTQQPILRSAVNIFIVYGQSLGRGQECWPVLSKTPRNDAGVYMLGLSTRPWTQTGTSFDPLYGSDPLNARLHPMVAVVNVNNTLPSDATIAAYAPGTNVPGEGPEVGAINFLRAAYLDHHGVEADPDTPWAVISCGVGGQSIEALSKPASNVEDSYYNRVLDGIAKVMAQPEFAGMDVRVPAILWLQGEEDYENGAASENPSIADYKAALRQLRTDLNADITALTGQAKAPAFVTYQTSGFNTEDFGNLFVGEAQLEAATQDTGLHMAAATYPLTDKTVHLDPNGSRWLGMQFGKVLARLLLRKEGWMPLHPRRATVSGTEVLIDFHVPEPPLQWGQPYVALAATDYANKGFVVRDAIGDIILSAVELVGQAMVRLTLTRPTSGAVRVEGGTKRGSGGNLCLKDSDRTIATENYEYAPGTGQYAGANIPALVGQPYPLENWCVNFSIQAETLA
ncbi:sialate O-acetylesterase [Sphingobium sp. RAC03]|uniref:sialate O-acetylesterase n=1 Tax=Sphingobium sp. RAC03 TaxID=1843368 RepID=UPI00083CD4FB|nr:sialate O-acetylesterase [Sphingobium sp. RAC03]AOF95510.1 hypothetical protein BSY17_2633 [Sphingobium sp. RAC03]